MTPEERLKAEDRYHRAYQLYVEARKLRNRVAEDNDEEKRDSDNLHEIDYYLAKAIEYLKYELSRRRVQR